MADLRKLTEPFDPDDVEFRAGATTQDKARALALPYVTSRAVMDRLDEVIGPQHWQDEYRPGPDGGVLCGISIRIGDEWITKFDGAENTNFEAVKGGLSDAFKRAAVKWGIGRYLYRLPAIWVKAEQRGKSVTIDESEARARMFGARPTTQNFATLDNLLFRLHEDFGLTESEAKAELKKAGYQSFVSSKSAEMYEAIRGTL